MDIDIQHMTREQLAAFLPAAISKAVKSYHDFAGRTIPAGGMEEKSAAKNFTEHHAACKAAITHIELLLKLARSAGMGDGADADGEAAAALILAAREDLSGFSEDYDEAE
jgi:hypothetical protein